jgi:hypothetical protein
MKDFRDRPASVTILTVFVLSITSWNVLRVYGALANWEILREFGASPAYIMGSGLGWAAAGLWLAYAIWTGQRRTFGVGLAISGLYLAWYWLDRLVIQPSPAPNVSFSAVFSAVLLVCFSLILWISKAFFDKETG